MGDGSLHPGKVWGGKCWVGSAGKEIGMSNFDFLTVAPGAAVWKPGRKGMVTPKNAILGGKLRTGDPLFICRANLGGVYSFHTGKLWRGQCIIGYNTKVVVRDTYGVLVLIKRKGTGIAADNKRSKAWGE
jgi:hypothetical protein